MINNVNEYIREQSLLFEDFNDAIPDMEKIEKANEVCLKLFDYIDVNLNHFEENVFFNIDAELISDELGIIKNKNIDDNSLMNIYKEIEETFKLGGRVNLEQYLNQGKIIYSSIINKLIGKVDYSLNYTEEELLKREKEALIRFSIVSSMKDLMENSKYFKLNPESVSYLNKYKKFFTKVNRLHKPTSIEEKLYILNNYLLGIENLAKTNEILDLNALNESISVKFKDVLKDSKYFEDKSIKDMFSSLNKTLEGFKNTDLEPLYDNVKAKISFIQNEFVLKKDLEL